MSKIGHHLDDKDDDDDDDGSSSGVDWNTWFVNRNWWKEADWVDCEDEDELDRPVERICVSDSPSFSIS